MHPFPSVINYVFVTNTAQTYRSIEVDDANDKRAPGWLAD